MDEWIIEGKNIVDREVKFFVNRYNLYKFMSKEDIEDMQSDCIVEMINVLKRYDPERASITTFLSPRIKGYFKDYLKKKSKMKTSEMNYVMEIISTNLDKVLSLESKEASSYLVKEVSNEEIKELILEVQSLDYSINDNLFDTILELPENRIYVILGFYVLDKSIKEIAKDMGISENSGWVYKIKRTGIDSLKKKLKTKIIYP